MKLVKVWLAICLWAIAITIWMRPLLVNFELSTKYITIAEYHKTLYIDTSIANIELKLGDICFIQAEYLYASHAIYIKKECIKSREETSEELIFYLKKEE